MARPVQERERLYERYFPLVILIFALPLFYYKLGALALVGPDEPRYAQVAREMYERGDWITPTLLGDTWFEKPALLYWMMIVCYHLLGVNEWAARLPNALLATLNLFIIYGLAKRVGGSRYGLISALVLATSGLYFGFARAASFDMTLTFTFTAAFLYLHLADTANDVSARRKYLLGFYFAVGVSLLAKGLIGIMLIGACSALYLILSVGWRRLFQFHPFTGLLVCLLIAGLWYLPVIARHGWLFIDEFFIQHHFQRYTSNKYHHPGPVYYFLGIILVGVTPWSLLILNSAVRGIKKLFNGRQLLDCWHSAIAKDRLLGLAAIWILVPLIFFSFSGSKLPGYILPIFPALALFIALEIETLLDRAGQRGLLVATAVVFLIIAIALAYFAHKKFQAGIGTQLLLAAVPFLTAVGVLFYWRRNILISFIVLMAMSPLMALTITTLLFPSIENEASLAPLARLAATQLHVNEKVIFFNYLQYSPLFYTNGRVVRGSDGEAVLVYNVDELAGYLEKQESLLCILKQRQLNLITNDPRWQSVILGRQRDLILLRISPHQH
ncbi:MAG: glycosyltransferase family 39 protein [Acidobacteriota bacterium]